MSDPIRAALERLIKDTEYLAKGGEDLDRAWAAIAAGKAALAERQGEGLSDEELWEMYDEHTGEAGDWAWVRDYARAAIALDRSRRAPQPPAEGEVAELVQWLHANAKEWGWVREYSEGAKCHRAAELLQLQHPTPVSVSEAVCNALIKAECALSDISEGEPEPGSGSAELLEWAEQRCAETLAVIRPVMKQHQIRTSEWPPLPAHALPLPQGEVEP
jgi:hypothetical protein